MMSMRRPSSGCCGFTSDASRRRGYWPHGRARAAMRGRLHHPLQGSSMMPHCPPVPTDSEMGSITPQQPYRPAGGIMRTRPRLDFVSDVSCPWCAIGLQSLLAALTNLRDVVECDLHFQPFELNPEMAAGGEDIA